MANEFVIRKGLISLGGATFPLTTVNGGNYSIDPQNDYYVSVNTGGSDRVVTLSSNAHTGQVFVIKNDASSGENITTTGVNVDGQSSLTLEPA